MKQRPTDDDTETLEALLSLSRVSASARRFLESIGELESWTPGQADKFDEIADEYLV